RLIGSQVEVDRVAVEDGIEVVDADVAVPAVVRVAALALVPLGGIAAPALVTRGAVPAHVAARQQTGLSGHLLEHAERLEDLTAVLADPRIARDGELVPDAGEVAPRPDTRVDDVGGAVYRMVRRLTRAGDGDDRHVEAVLPVLLDEVALEVLRLLDQRA